MKDRERRCLASSRRHGREDDMGLESIEHCMLWHGVQDMHSKNRSLPTKLMPLGQTTSCQVAFMS